MGRKLGAKRSCWVWILAVATLAGCGSDAGDTATPSTSADAQTTEAPVTTAPTTTAATELTPSAALTFTVQNITASPSFGSVNIAFSAINNSAKTIVAYQVAGHITLKDPLGHSIQAGPGSADCIPDERQPAVSVAPGQTLMVEPGTVGRRGCTNLGFRVNDATADAFYRATNPGVKARDSYYSAVDPVVDIRPTRVVFDDGTSVGRAG